jgi:hypothetical protein
MGLRRGGMESTWLATTDAGAKEPTQVVAADSDWNAVASLACDHECPVRAEVTTPGIMALRNIIDGFHGVVHKLAAEGRSVKNSRC